MVGGLVEEATEAARAIALLFTHLAGFESTDTNMIEETLGEEVRGISPFTFGVLVRQHLPNILDGKAMNMPSKRYWMAVAESLGPDWIEAFDTAGNWMKRVEGFK